MSSDAGSRPMTAQEFQQAEGTGDWRVLGGGASAWYAAPDTSGGAALARRVLTHDASKGLVDLDVRSTGVLARIPVTPEDGGFRPEHVEAARAVARAAAELRGTTDPREAGGLRPDPTVVQDVQLTFDVRDQGRVSVFWEKALGLEPVGEEDLLDPGRRHSPIWFQDMDAPRPLRNRIHLDAVTPEPVASLTLTALERAGGKATRHGYYATVSDPEGNEVDVLPLQVGADRWEGAETSDWRLVFSAMACYPVADAEQAAELVEAVAALADEVGVPLGIDVRPGLVTLDSGKDRWDMDERYEVLAAQVQRAARGLGLAADVSLPRFVQVGIDAVDIPALRRFWCAALGYENDPRDGVTDIVDPRQLSMPFFFQDLDADDGARRGQRNRIHVDLFVPAELAADRVAAAVAAGGRVVRDEAPDGVTVQDPEGNEIDIAVSVGREERFAATQAGS